MMQIRPVSDLRNKFTDIEKNSTKWRTHHGGKTIRPHFTKPR